MTGILVFDYLLKPIAFPRFLKACHRLLKQQGIQQPNETETQQETSDFIYLKSGATTYKVN